MENIRNLSITRLKDKLKEYGYPSYRTKQILKWIWQKGVNSFNDMTDLKKEDRNKLSRHFSLKNLIIENIKTDKTGTRKFVFHTDNNPDIPQGFIETVYIPQGKRHTVCLSTQLGCPLNCTFCRTGYYGFKRNLTLFEILSQLLEVKRHVEKVSNIVFMGMGEPFLNWTNVKHAIEIINSDFGFKIGARKITVSTAGHIPGIKKLFEFPLQVKLAVSLNAANEKTRSFLMPINRHFHLKNLMETLKEYYNVKKKRITFEYVLIKDINDSIEHARELVKLIKHIPCKLNLIPYNPFPEKPFKKPDFKRIETFKAFLYKALKSAVSVRRSRGSSLLGACGQLIYKKQKEV